MGNCCSGTTTRRTTTGSNEGRSDQNDNNVTTSRPINSTQPFQGEGRRLGTAEEIQTMMMKERMDEENNNINVNNLPKQPILYDETISNDEREKIRAERAAAAEARLKKMGGTTKKVKKQSNNDEPLRGPNSKSTMTWTVG